MNVHVYRTSTGHYRPCVIVATKNDDTRVNLVWFGNVEHGEQLLNAENNVEYGDDQGQYQEAELAEV